MSLVLQRQARTASGSSARIALCNRVIYPAAEERFKYPGNDITHCYGSVRFSWVLSILASRQIRVRIGLFCQTLNIVARQAVKKRKQGVFVICCEMQGRNPRVLAWPTTAASVVIVNHGFKREQDAIVHRRGGQGDIP